MRLKENNYLVLGTNVENGYDVRDIDKPYKFCLIMGNEGNGVRKEIQDMYKPSYKEIYDRLAEYERRFSNG